MDLVEGLKSIDFEDESYPTYQEFLFFPLFAIFFPTVRFFLDRLVFEGIGKRLVFNKELDFETDEKSQKLSKFKESAWKFVYYLSAEIFALAVTYNEPWFTKTANFYIGPGDEKWPDQRMKLKLKALYMFSGGFFVYSIFALIFWEARRTDFKVLMGHHVASTILIALSYISRFGRVGSIVLAIHDANDVFLEIGKMFKYSGAEVLASFSFFVFAFSWVVLRLICFPYWILYSTSYEMVQELDKENPDLAFYFYVFNTLLYSLFVFHIYWSVLIYRSLIKWFENKGKVGDDVRSGSESEEELQNPKIVVTRD